MNLAGWLLEADRGGRVGAVVADMPRWDSPTWQGEDEPGSGLPAAVHSRQWSPARVLAECAAKRKIVEDAQQVPTVSLRRVLRILALPYADRPGYLPMWRP